jgi:magnesium chelatase subunit H
MSVNRSPREQAEKLTAEERDRRVLKLYEQVAEVEQRLIPTGLHVFGQVSGTDARADMLRMVASFARPEANTRALTELIAEGLGLQAYAALASAAREDEAALRSRERVDTLATSAIKLFIAEGTAAAVRWLEHSAHVNGAEAIAIFNLLEKISAALETNNELDALMRSLRGEYIEPGPGADIVQNPGILPTGRNTHAVNPYTVPSAIAFARAEGVVHHLLERHRLERGRYPRSMALVRWGLDNIKTQGEGVAQALWLLGVRPVRDAMNRATAVEVIPLETLGRPRIDVVMTVSGIVRVLFGATFHPLD